MRTECMICDGCGQHEQINQFRAHDTLMRSSDYLPEGWVMVKAKNLMTYHSLECATQSAGQLALFTEGESND